MAELEDEREQRNPTVEADGSRGEIHVGRTTVFEPITGELPYLSTPSGDRELLTADGGNGGGH